jgi:multicomponent Na+:H+ antiporter subunit F
MTFAEAVLDGAVYFALAILSLSLLIAVWRVFKGPTLPDRVVALDMLVVIAIGFLGTIGIRTGYTLYVDIALALGLVGFLATVAFARFMFGAQGGPQKREDEASATEGEC